MISNEAYTLDRICEYKGVEYRVINTLSNDLLLVVKKDDFENDKFPLQTFIIPDEYMIDFYKQEKQRNQ